MDKLPEEDQLGAPPPPPPSKSRPVENLQSRRLRQRECRAVQVPSSSRDRRYECTSIVASETLRVSCQENFKAGALRLNVGKVTIIHLKDLRR